MKILYRQTIHIVGIIGAAVMLFGCSLPSENGPESPTDPAVIVPQIATPTATSQPAVIVLAAGPGSDAVLAAEMQTYLAGLAAQRGWQFERRETLKVDELGDTVRVVVVLGPDPGLHAIVPAAPQVQFVAVGIGGLQPASNLSIFGGDGTRVDQQGFMAGYIAAVVTDEWRVGVLSVSNSADGVAARQGFLSGVEYFCGLCLPVYPPFYEYPMYSELPGGSDAAAWRSAADLLRNKGVKGIYVAPGVGDVDLLGYLAQSGILIIGSSPMVGELGGNWVVTIGVDMLAALQEQLPNILDGAGGGNYPLQIKISDINPAYISEGRLAHIQEVMVELLAGYIETGAQ